MGLIADLIDSDRQNARDKYSDQVTSFPELVYETTKDTIVEAVRNTATEAWHPFMSILNTELGVPVQAKGTDPAAASFNDSEAPFWSTLLTSALTYQLAGGPFDTFQRLIGGKSVMDTNYSESLADVFMNVNDPPSMLNNILTNHLGFGSMDIQNLINRFNPSVD